MLMNNIRRLRCFSVIAQENSFTRAARRLNVDTSALSRAISELEKELGVVLLDRAGRSVRLTAAGARYAHEVDGVLWRLDRANNDIGCSLGGKAAVIRIGLLYFAGTQGRMADAFRGLRVDHPDTELSFQPMGSLEQIQALEAKKMDAGFVLDWPGSSHVLNRIRVSTAIWQVALRESHPLAHAPHVRLRDLASEDFVSMGSVSSPFLYWDLDKVCVASGVDIKTVEHCGNVLSFMTLIAAGRGIGFVTSLVEPVPGVIFKTIEDVDLQLPFNFVWRKDASDPRLIGAINTMRRALEGVSAVG